MQQQELMSLPEFGARVHEKPTANQCSIASCSHPARGRAEGGNGPFHPMPMAGCCWHLLHGAVGVQKHILLLGSAAGGGFVGSRQSIMIWGSSCPVSVS